MIESLSHWQQFRTQTGTDILTQVELRLTVKCKPQTSLFEMLCILVPFDKCRPYSLSILDIFQISDFRDLEFTL